MMLVAVGGLHEPPIIEFEALAIHSVLVRLGVPETALLRETASRNTRQDAAEAWRSL